MPRVQIPKHPNMVLSRPSPVNWTREYFSKWAWHMKPGMERPELCAEFTTDPKRLYGFRYKEHAQATMGMLLVQLGVTTKMNCWHLRRTAKPMMPTIPDEPMGEELERLKRLAGIDAMITNQMLLGQAYAIKTSAIRASGKSYMTQTLLDMKAPSTPPWRKP